MEVKMANGYRCANCGYQEAEHEGALASNLTILEMEELYPDLVKCKKYRSTKEEREAEKKEEKEKLRKAWVLEEYGGY